MIRFSNLEEMNDTKINCKYMYLQQLETDHVKKNMYKYEREEIFNKTDELHLRQARDCLNIFFYVLTYVAFTMFSNLTK